MTRKLYGVNYWRNDGEWHNGDYFRQVYAFYARDDAEARRLAWGYLKSIAGSASDLGITGLVELTLKKRKIRMEEKARWEPSSADKIKRARFVPLEDRILG